MSEPECCIYYKSSSFDDLDLFIDFWKQNSIFPEEDTNNRLTILNPDIKSDIDKIKIDSDKINNQIQKHGYIHIIIKIGAESPNNIIWTIVIKNNYLIHRFAYYFVNGTQADFMTKTAFKFFLIYVLEQKEDSSFWADIDGALPGIDYESFFLEKDVTIGHTPDILCIRKEKKHLIESESNVNIKEIGKNHICIVNSELVLDLINN